MTGGLLSPPSVWRLKPFVYRLEGLRCDSCGHFHPLNHFVCRKCGSKKLVRDRLPERGRLVHFTVVTQAQHGFEHVTPFIVGLVQMDDGTYLVGQMTDCDPENLTPGTVVEAVVRRLRADGDSRLIAYGIKFRPVI